MRADKHVLIMGTRGVPARHGGFETFAERLALHLVSRDWRVSVYCQEEGRATAVEDEWRGIRRVRLAVPGQGAASTILFDWKATRHALGERAVALTLGYNTALFCSLLRARGLPNLINMDGIEWQRRKWGRAAKAWFYLNERAGCLLGNALVADHPEIQRHLATRVSAAKIAMIPYGAERVTRADAGCLKDFGLEGGHYLTLIARPEPENSVLEIVRAFSRQRRPCELAVLGHYDPQRHAYHRAVLEAAGPQVKFLGALYEPLQVRALRLHCLAYVHGHQVGGTNPSLVEAMGAGNAVLAHDNRFNRWVAGEGALYFRDEDELALRLEQVLGDAALRAAGQERIRQRFEQEFSWERVLSAYEDLLSAWLPEARQAGARES